MTAPRVETFASPIDHRLETLAQAAVAPGLPTLPEGALAEAANAAGQLPVDPRLRAIAFTAWLIAAAAVSELPVAELIESLTSTAGRLLDLETETLLVEIHAYAAADPRFNELLPAASVARHLALAAAFTGSDEMTVWRPGVTGDLELVAQTGEVRQGDLAGLVAAAAMGEGSDQWVYDDATFVAVPISREREPVAALVARFPEARAEAGTRTVAAVLRAAATRLAQILDRELILEQNAAHDQIITATADRRLVRLGYDLHDGPTQDLIVLAGDLERLRRQVSEHGLVDSRIDHAFAELQRRIEATDKSLRELAHSLQPQTIVEHPLDTLLGREIERLRERYSIEGSLDIEGDLDDLTATQRITIFRTVQEALTNVREHSCATSAEVKVAVGESEIEVVVSDDGVGFDVTSALESARLRGRMGVAGITERIRMLGGDFSVESKEGGPTTVAARLPRWRPPEE